MHDIFISYSSKNQRESEKIRHTLELADVTCWHAIRDISAGSDYSQEIPGAIRDCNVFLLLLTEDAQKSDHVYSELKLAVDYKKLIIPCRLDNSEITDRFIYHLTARQWVDFTGNQAAALWEILKEVKRLRLLNQPKNRTPEAMEAEKRLNQVTEVYLGLMGITLLILMEVLLSDIIDLLPLPGLWGVGIQFGKSILIIVLLIRLSIWILGGKQDAIRYMAEYTGDLLKKAKKKKK